MQRTAVESGKIRSVGYDADTKVLEVEFAGGRVYQYFDVPKEKHEGFMSAESKGAFFNQQINGQYKYERQG
jgi:hypothetical protein